MQASKPAKINWLEWGPEAFKKAAEENKPILLAIGAVWCHWCHVQDKTTYSDPGIVRLVNRDYVAIRVDNDKRPDINRRYNMGGWPTTAFLSPDGGIISGGTYIPADKMMEILRRVKEYYLRRKDKTPTPVPWPQEPETPATGTELSKAIVDDVLGSVVMSFDSVYGGFGDGPKFPHADALKLALSEYWCTGDKGLLTIFTKTLDNMAGGGICDREEGGFFRYSTMRDWSTPHYEKMCEDNARLLAVYTDGYSATRRESYREVARSIVEYVRRSLSDQDRGGFYGSQDADEGYYRLPKAERSSIKAPSVDQTVYAGWSGLMISAFLHAAPILNDTSLEQFALKSIERLLNEGCSSQSNAMYHCISEGQPSLRGLLADQVAFGAALVDAYQASGDASCVSRARELVNYMDSVLLDLKSGGYYDSPTSADSLGYLKRPVKPLDENSMAGILLTRLYHLTGDEAYRERARSTLESFTGDYRNYSSAASAYALAVDMLLNQATEMVVVGSRADPLVRELHAACLRAYEPRKLVIPLDPTSDAESLARRGYPSDAGPRVYICSGKTCLAPITQPAEIAHELSRLQQAGS